MDEADLFKLSGVSAGTVAIVLIVYRVLKSVVGKKLVSSCCGRKYEVGIDVQPVTPSQTTTIQIKNPMPSVDEAQRSESRPS